ncbi:hypothetical protein LSAT2_022885 [Lamellibrachia satsuma]|nr:hypothetical protein LSAT2_022885 [Lamellibrachia satsuma]
MEMILEDSEVGMLCCVNEGCEWYRAIICDNTDATKLFIKYVDYSSIVTIDRQRVKLLLDALCELAPLAVQCYLAGAHQVDEKGWSKEAYVQLCIQTEGGCFTIEFLTSDT